MGGGGGGYTHAVLARFDGARGLIVDRADAEATVRALATDRGFAARTDFAALDIVVDPLPTGKDVIILSNVVHCLSPEANARLIGNIARSLSPGGVVAIKDYTVDAEHTGPALALRFAVTMAVNSEGGGVYSPAEVSTWCIDAGLEVLAAFEMTQAEGSYTVVARRGRAQPRDISGE